MAAFFSIIVPSFLGEYPFAATNRDTKIFRAINSVFNQTFKDYELIIIADGCERSYEIANRISKQDSRVVPVFIEKSPLWSGKPRNKGLETAKGLYSIYLDIDDFYGATHLESIHNQIVKNEYPYWLFFDDYIGSKEFKFYRRVCLHDVLHRNGTSNICHKTDTDCRWGSDYEHDYNFIRLLTSKAKPVIIPPQEYFVCHYPKILDI